MDQDLKKALKDMADGIKVLSQALGNFSNVNATSSTAADAEKRLATLEERSAWHRNIGWGVAVLYGTAFLALLT